MPARDPATARSEPESARHGALGHLSADEELQQTVCAALIGAANLDSTELGVRVTQGDVTLSGSVTSREDWLLAVRIARDQAGVSAVHTEQLRISGG